MGGIVMKNRNVFKNAQRVLFYYLVVMLSLSVLAGCSPTRNLWIIKDVHKYKFESACIVVDEDASPEFKETITNNLSQRGVKLYPASSKKDCPADFVVLYYDKYGFEITFPAIPLIFLEAFGMRFYDPKSDEILVTADYWTTHWHQTLFTKHRVPDELLNSMFDEIHSQAGSSSDKIPSQADTSTKSLTQKLQELQTALDNGLITKEEYQIKRKLIIEKY